MISIGFQESGLNTTFEFQKSSNHLFNISSFNSIVCSHNTFQKSQVSETILTIHFGYISEINLLKVSISFSFCHIDITECSVAGIEVPINSFSLFQL